MNEKVLGKHLQAARQKAGLTQQALCNQAGLSYSTLAKIERGAIKAPSIFTVAAISRVIGVTLEELLGEILPSSPAAQRVTRKSRSGISFVYFDINGVLVRFFQRAFVKLAEDTGATPDAIEATFWHYNDSVCRGAMSVAEFDGILASELKLDKVDWASYYFAAIDPIPEMQETLQWAASHYKVGLLSNIMPGFVGEMLTRKLIPRLQYDAVVDSSSVGAVKPEAKIYEIAQEKAGVPANEILLIDDGRTNLMAADQNGWHVLWFDGYRPRENAERVRETLAF